MFISANNDANCQHFRRLSQKWSDVNGVSLSAAAVAATP